MLTWGHGSHGIYSLPAGRRDSVAATPSTLGRHSSDAERIQDRRAKCWETFLPRLPQPKVNDMLHPIANANGCLPSNPALFLLL